MTLWLLLNTTKRGVVCLSFLLLLGSFPPTCSLYVLVLVLYRSRRFYNFSFYTCLLKPKLHTPTRATKHC